MTSTRCVNPRCQHHAQIHGADKSGAQGGYLTPDGPRGEGACTANRCECERFRGEGT